MFQKSGAGITDMHGETFTVCSQWLSLTFKASFYFSFMREWGQYGRSKESKNSSEESGDSSLNNNIHLDNLMTPQARGKLAREGWRAATAVKEIWFPGKLPSQEKGRWGREGRDSGSRGKVTGVPWCPLPAMARH